ncbi:MAG: hypothetical protein ACK49D_12410 [Flavobacteriia bacterium]|jgi:hypothetical protein|nr:hypothetical protein [Cryomorphaceae bacterium]
MRTTTYILKVTDEERKANDLLLRKFNNAFYCGFDTVAMERLLHPCGRFFGNMNYIRAISYMRNKACGKNGIGERYYKYTNYGVATDYGMGEVVMELRFSDFDPFTDNEDPTHEFGVISDFRYDELIFHFAFTFKDGRIFSIRVPKSFEKSIAWIAARN